MANAEVLFTLYRDRMFRYFYRAAGHPETAEDLTQEVFLRVSRSAVPTAADGEVAAWLFRIARNLVLDHRRQIGRRLPDGPAGTPDGGQRPPSQETSAAVNEALASLTEVDRDIFLLKEVVGLGYAEIANTCDLTPDAVRNRIHRARVALREQLAAPIAERRAGPVRR